MEVFIKSIIRNQSWLTMYFQFVAVGSAAIVIAPEYVRWAVWLLIVFIIGNLTKVFIRRVIGHPFLNVVAWPKIDEGEVAYHCMIFGVVPGVFILSLLFNILTFKWWGMAFGLVTGVILTMIISQFFSKKAIEP